MLVSARLIVKKEAILPVQMDAPLRNYTQRSRSRVRQGYEAAAPSVPTGKQYPFESMATLSSAPDERQECHFHICLAHRLTRS